MEYSEYEKKKIYNEIHAQNELNKVLNDLTPKLQEAFKDFKGKQILRTDFSLIKKVSDKIKDLLNRDNYNIIPLNEGDNARVSIIYISSSEYSVYLKVSLCFSGGSYDNKTYYCFYKEGYSYFIRTDKTILKEFTEYENKDLISFEEEYKQFLKCKKIKEELKTEMDKLKLQTSRKEFD